ncbi:hypothetical protein PC112_g297 [Phytophthora cactorum]|nr:hypothetical protein PC112_g297 [Phytophthora cactorum]
MKRKRKDRRIVAGLAMKRKRKDRRIVAVDQRQWTQVRTWRPLHRMLRFGYDGCRVMETYMENAVFLRQALVDTDFFNIVDKAHMPLVAFSLKDSSAYTCFDKLKGRDDHARGGQAELLVPNG